MVNNKPKNKNKEKTSLYGEMIPSMFNWLTPDIQKFRAKHLENITKEK